MTFTVSSRLPRPVPGLFLVLGIVLGATTAAAQPNQTERPASQGARPAMPGGHSAQEIQQTREKIQQLSSQLQEIQKSTLEANPELKAQSEEFQALLDQTMADSGFEAQKARDRLDSIRTEVKNGDASEQEKQALAREYQAKRQELSRARREAMSSEDVKGARATLNKDLVAAMTQQNPRTKQLLAELNKVNQQYRQMLRQMMQQQGGSGQGR